MTIHFIEAEIDLQESPAQLNRAIRDELSKRGDPLRWSIDATDRDRQTARVTAIVTTDDPSHSASGDDGAEQS